MLYDALKYEKQTYVPLQNSGVCGSGSKKMGEVWARQTREKLLTALLIMFYFNLGYSNMKYICL